MLVALLILLSLALALTAWFLVAQNREAARLTEESRRRLDEAQTEHQKRVDRLRRKVDGWRERGHLELAADLLPAFDALGHALEQARRSRPDPDQPGPGAAELSGDVAALLDGLEMVDRELTAVLARHGIEACRPQAGDAFDPNLHEAVSVDADAEVAPGRVVACLRPGYVHQDRVLRSAAVCVAPKTPGSDAPSPDPSDMGAKSAQAGISVDASDDEAGAADEAVSDDTNSSSRA